jgi:twitching motility protein PilT
MAKIDELFRMMVEKGASDLHLAAGSAPLLRLDGEMAPTGLAELSNEDCQNLIFEILRGHAGHSDKN